MDETGLGVFYFIELIITVLLIASGWKIFKKAGQPGWAFIIPIYNVIVLLKIVGKPFLMIIPLVNIIFGIWTLNLLSKSFGKSEGFTIGLFLLGIIFFPILAFGDAEYQGPAAADAAQNYPEYAK